MASRRPPSSPPPRPLILLLAFLPLLLAFTAAGATTRASDNNNNGHVGGDDDAENSVLFEHGPPVAEEREHDATRRPVNLGSPKRAVLRVALRIHELYDFDLVRGTFSARVQLLLSTEDTEGRPRGSAMLDAGSYAFPFSDVRFDGLSTETQDDYRMVVVASDRTVTSRQRYVLHALCRFQLDTYPFERHRCALTVTAVRHPVRHLELEWLSAAAAVGLSAPVELDDDVMVGAAAGLRLAAVKPTVCRRDSIYALTRLSAATARYGCLQAELVFVRSLWSASLRLLLPAAAAVFISWIALWAPRSQPLLRLCILSTATFVLSITASLQPFAFAYRGVSNADIWLIICSIPISLGFIHFFAVMYLHGVQRKFMALGRKGSEVRESSQLRHERQAARHAKMAVVARQHRERSVLDDPEVSASFDRVVRDEWRQRADEHSLCAARLDLTARLLLPVAFALPAAVFLAIRLVVRPHTRIF